jgi:adenosylcobinamide-phosphate synthase
LVLGAVADAVFADPARWHPVAGFGSCATALERRWYRDRRSAGIAYAAALVAAVVGLGAAAEAATRRRPVVHAIATAVATWAVLGGTSLSAHGKALAALLDGASTSNLDAAREVIPALCGRDPRLLDATGMARAGTESMAENTSDAAVAPLLWGAVAGIPGLVGYRAINTLDAMVGYRSPRYRRFGWAAARADDVVNLVPSRVTALLSVGLASAVGGSPRAAVVAWRRDARAHPSPNAGPVEAATAGALGVGLGGPTAYAHGVEDRPRLGSGPPPTPTDLRRAARLSQVVATAATLIACAIAISRERPIR